MRIFRAALLREKACQRQPGSDMVGVGGIQRPRVAVHRRLVLPHNEQRLSGRHQHTRAFPVALLGSGNVLDRLRKAIQLCVRARHLRVNHSVRVPAQA